MNEYPISIYPTEVLDTSIELENIINRILVELGSSVWRCCKLLDFLNDSKSRPSLIIQRQIYHMNKEVYHIYSIKYYRTSYI